MVATWVVNVTSFRYGPPYSHPQFRTSGELRAFYNVNILKKVEQYRTVPFKKKKKKMLKKRFILYFCGWGNVLGPH